MSLREKIVRGGAYLTARHGLSLIIGLVGIVLLNRAIGPENYGLYASALGITGYLSTLAGLGINVYILRREDEPEINIFHQAFTLVFLTGASGLLLGVAAFPLLQWWFQNPAFIPPLLTMLVTLPLTALASPAMARLEHSLNYRAVASIELAGQLIYYTVSLILAYLGRGVWAPVTGYLAWQFFFPIAACATARLSPRPFWNRSLVRDMLGYGASYSASIWVWQLRTLVNPLLIGRYLGPEGVGYIALVIKIVESLSFIKGAVWRLSIVTLSKLQGDYLLLKHAAEEAMTLQVLALGPLLAIFACSAPWLIPIIFGESWNAVLILYPFIASGCLVNTLFSMHSSALYVLRRNSDVTIFHVVHVALLAGGVLLFLPRFGLLGYGLAEVLALLSYAVIHLQVGRLFCYSYVRAVPWLISFLPPLFATIFNLPSGFLLWVPLLIVLTIPGPRQSLTEYTRVIRIKD